MAKHTKRNNRHHKQQVKTQRITRKHGKKMLPVEQSGGLGGNKLPQGPANGPQKSKKKVLPYIENKPKRRSLGRWFKNTGAKIRNWSTKKARNAEHWFDMKRGRAGSAPKVVPPAGNTTKVSSAPMEPKKVVIQSVESNKRPFTPPSGGLNSRKTSVSPVPAILEDNSNAKSKFTELRKLYPNMTDASLKAIALQSKKNSTFLRLIERAEERKSVPSMEVLGTKYGAEDYLEELEKKTAASAAKAEKLEEFRKVAARIAEQRGTKPEDYERAMNALINAQLKLQADFPIMNPEEKLKALEQIYAKEISSGKQPPPPKGPKSVLPEETRVAAASEYVA